MSVTYQTDINTAKILSSQQGKFILIIFGKIGCSQCDQQFSYFQSQIFSDYLNTNFILVKNFIDIDTKTYIPYAVGKGGSALPFFVLVNPSSANLYFARLNGFMGFTIFKTQMDNAIKNEPKPTSNPKESQTLPTSSIDATNNATLMQLESDIKDASDKAKYYSEQSAKNKSDAQSLLSMLINAGATPTGGFSGISLNNDGSDVNIAGGSLSPQGVVNAKEAVHNSNLITGYVQSDGEIIGITSAITKQWFNNGTMLLYSVLAANPIVSSTYKAYTKLLSNQNAIYNQAISYRTAALKSATDATQTMSDIQALADKNITIDYLEKVKNIAISSSLNMNQSNLLVIPLYNEIAKFPQFNNVNFGIRP